MSKLDSFLEGAPVTEPTVNIGNTVRILAMNKDVKKFLIAIGGLSKADWANFMKNCKKLYQVLQSSALVKNDKSLEKEVIKYPWVAHFFARLNEDE